MPTLGAGPAHATHRGAVFRLGLDTQIERSELDAIAATCFDASRLTCSEPASMSSTMRPQARSAPKAMVSRARRAINTCQKRLERAADGDCVRRVGRLSDGLRQRPETGQREKQAGNGKAFHDVAP
jgi:hypothetical protein